MDFYRKPHQPTGSMIAGKGNTKKDTVITGNIYEKLKSFAALANNSHLSRAMGSTAFGAPTVPVEGLSEAGK